VKLWLLDWPGAMKNQRRGEMNKEQTLERLLMVYSDNPVAILSAPYYDQDGEFCDGETRTEEEYEAVIRVSRLHLYLFLEFLELKGFKDLLPEEVSPELDCSDDKISTEKFRRRYLRFDLIVEDIVVVLRQSEAVKLAQQVILEEVDDEYIKSLRFDLIGKPGISKNSRAYHQLTTVLDAVRMIATKARESKTSNPEMLKLFAELFTFERQLEEQVGGHVVINPGLSDDEIDVIRQGRGKQDYDGSRIINQSRRPFHSRPDKSKKRRQ